MNIDEFESWIETYLEYFIERRMLYRLKDPNDSLNDFWAFRVVIQQQIRDVIPQEDQDFLTIKYSDYLF